MKNTREYRTPEISVSRDEEYNTVLCQSPSGEIEPWTEENVEW